MILLKCSRISWQETKLFRFAGNGYVGSDQQHEARNYIAVWRVWAERHSPVKQGCQNCQIGKPHWATSRSGLAPPSFTLAAGITGAPQTRPCSHQGTLHLLLRQVPLPSPEPRLVHLCCRDLTLQCANLVYLSQCKSREIKQTFHTTTPHEETLDFSPRCIGVIGKSSGKTGYFGICSTSNPTLFTAFALKQRISASSFGFSGKAFTAKDFEKQFRKSIIGKTSIKAKLEK